MKFKPLLLTTISCVGLSVFSTPAYSATLTFDLFVERVNNGQIHFVGIDPNDLGNPDAVPLELAQLEDTDGTLGEISFSSPGFWRFVGKGMMVVGSTAGGTLGGAAAGTVVPGLGTAAGAIIGGGAGLLSSVGTAIVLNTGESNPNLTQDIAIFDQIIIEDTITGGPVDLASAITASIIADPNTTTFLLPGGGSLLQPSLSLFAGSKIVDQSNTELQNGEVAVGMIDADGNISTTSDQTVAVLFQDLVRGIELTDEILIDVDNIIDPTLRTDGDPIISRSIFAQTFVSVPEATSTLSILTLGALGAVSSLKRKQKQ